MNFFLFSLLLFGISLSSLSAEKKNPSQEVPRKETEILNLDFTLGESFLSYTQLDWAIDQLYQQNLAFSLKKLSPQLSWEFGVKLPLGPLGPVVRISSLRAKSENTFSLQAYSFKVSSFFLRLGLERELEIWRGKPFQLKFLPGVTFSHRLIFRVGLGGGLCPTSVVILSHKNRNSYLEKWTGMGWGASLRADLAYSFYPKFSFLLGIRSQLVRVNNFNFSLISLDKAQKKSYQEKTKGEMAVGEPVKWGPKEEDKVNLFLDGFILNFSLAGHF
jgi:hypothetical protein